MVQMEPYARETELGPSSALRLDTLCSQLTGLSSQMVLPGLLGDVPQKYVKRFLLGTEDWDFLSVTEKAFTCEGKAFRCSLLLQCEWISCLMPWFSIRGSFASPGICGNVWERTYAFWLLLRQTRNIAEYL